MDTRKIQSLEPVAVDSVNADGLIADKHISLSIAISLKRIADAMTCVPVMTQGIDWDKDAIKASQLIFNKG